MTMRVRQHRPVAAVLVAVAMLAVTGCGGDDDNDASATSTTEAEQPADEAEADTEAFCDALVDPRESADELAAAVAAAPDEISADVTTMADEKGRADIQVGPGGGPSSDSFYAAAASVGDYMADNCGYQVIDVTATDYAFHGIPADAEATKTLIRLTNDGAEYHDLVVQRIHSGETRSIEEIMALPDPEGGDLLDFQTGVFTPPGQSSWTVVDLSVAGRYAVMDFVPTGATPAALNSGQIDDTEPAHWTKGELAEIKAS
jgi:hypothetical protein